ncbi:MAG: hypothetical protein WAK01_07460 [Methylocystis sp.]
MPLASLLRDRFLTLLANGGETLDWSAVGALAAWQAGAGNLGAAGGRNGGGQDDWLSQRSQGSRY